jgi:hypothetical protein
MSLFPELLALVFKNCECETKIAFSQVNKYMAEHSKNQVSDIYTAIADLDYYSLIYTTDLTWTMEISRGILRRSKNTRLICRYIEHTNAANVFNIVASLYIPMIDETCDLLTHDDPKIIEAILSKFTYKSGNYMRCYNRCLICSCKQGYLKNAKYLLELFSVQELSAIEHAYRDNIILYRYVGLGSCKFLVDIGNLYNYLMYSAIDIGADDIINLLLKKFDLYSNSVLFIACYRGDIRLVESITRDKKYNWDIGLCGACIQGNIDVVKHMLQMGATNTNMGIYTLLYHGHRDVATYLISVNNLALDNDLIKINSEHGKQ